MIELKKIKKIYTNQTSQTVALDEVDISFPERGFIAVTGESGSGKTTLLNILGCLDMPTSGEFFLEGRDMSEKSKSGNADFYASKIGMIFQDYNVFEDLTVLENIKMSTETVDCGNRNLEFELDEIMEFLGIKECANKYVRDLSGGQRQRVAIARAIIKKPLYILADEPTGNLDSRNSKAVFEKLKEISKDLLVVCVTHDKNMAEQYCDRIITFEDGKIISDSEETTSVIAGKKQDDDAGRELGAVKKSISIKNLKNYSGKILKKNEKKSIINNIIVCITAFLIILFTNLVFFDMEGVLECYLQKYSKNGFVFSKRYTSKSTKDIFTITYSKELYSISQKASFGGYNYRQLEIDLSDYATHMDVSEETLDADDLFQDEQKDIKVILRLLDDDAFASLTGCKDNQKNLIIVSKAVANSLAKKKGDKIYWRDKELVIGGIVESKEFVNDQTVDDEQKEFCRLNDSFYAYISVLYDGFYDYNTYYIPGAFYMDSFYKYKNIQLDFSEYSENEVITGKKPENKNEIAIDEEMLGRMDKEPDEVIGQKYRLYDMYDPQYDHEYDNIVNLYDFLGPEVVITGVVRGMSSVLVTHDVFKQLTDEVRFFSGSNIGLKSGNLNKSLGIILDENCRIVDPVLDLAYNDEDTRKSMMPLFILVVLALSALYMVFMISFLLFFIKDNSRNIGILKSLGYKYKDIKTIFMFRQLKRIIFDEIAGLFVFLATVYVANRVAREKMLIRPYDLYNVNFTATIIVMILMFLCSIIATIVPLRKIDKMTIISALKNTP